MQRSISKVDGVPPEDVKVLNDKGMQAIALTKAQEKAMADAMQPAVKKEFLSESGADGGKLLEMIERALSRGGRRAGSRAPGLTRRRAARSRAGRASPARWSSGRHGDGRRRRCCSRAGLIGWAVVMRYAFNAAPVWVDDMVGFLLVAVVMLAAAQTLRRGEHIGVDLLVARLSSDRPALGLAWAALRHVRDPAVLSSRAGTRRSSRGSSACVTEGALEWPIVVLMLFMPLGGMLLLLAAVRGVLARARRCAADGGAGARSRADGG